MTALSGIVMNFPKGHFVFEEFLRYDVLKRAGISSKKEAPVNFLTDPLEGRSTLRPADILVFGWAGGKHACVDLTGVSPLVGFRENGFVAGQAALKAESSKVAKHEKACLENQHVFIPFAFDTFGFLAPETEKFLNRVQRVVQNLIKKFLRNFVDEALGDVHLWNSWIPCKINVCVWRDSINRLPTRANLSSCGIPIPSTLCPFSANEVENIEHCLLLCPFIKSVWRKVYGWWNFGPAVVFPPFSMGNVKKFGSKSMNKIF
nr:putative exostosin-like protein [Tanacetum cinerariifolium]